MIFLLIPFPESKNKQSFDGYRGIWPHFRNKENVQMLEQASKVNVINAIKDALL